MDPGNILGLSKESKKAETLGLCGGSDIAKHRFHETMPGLNRQSKMT